MNKIFLSIGGNLGDRKANLAKAIESIAKDLGPIKAISSSYETKAWGGIEQPDFLNQALLVATWFSPINALKAVLNIENKMGRVRKQKWGARIIDIDLLFFNEAIIETVNLIIPHPRIAERNFVIAPLAEIAPDFIHPVFQKSIHQLNVACKDPLPIALLKTT